MAKEHSMDISVAYDEQEVRNAVDQAKREATNRYDLKDAGVEIELVEEMIAVTAGSEHQVEAVVGILAAKMVSRGVSAKVMDRQGKKEIGGMRVKEEILLVKALDGETAKKISKMIRDEFGKVKPSIQGEVVRVSGKSIDDLQAVKAMLMKSS